MAEARTQSVAWRILRCVASLRLALVLVALLMVFTLVGAVVPQAGVSSPQDIIDWSAERPGMATAIRALGFFDIFQSIPFLLLAAVLALNTAACTVVHLADGGGWPRLRGPRGIERTGFLLVHIAILALFAAGFWSGAIRMDARFLLIEGQSIRESHQAYPSIVEGRFRECRHGEYDIVLEKVAVRYVDRFYPADLVSSLAFYEGETRIGGGEVRVNRPLRFRGVDFTQDEIGYAPRLVIRDEHNGSLLADAYIALKTFGRGAQAEFRDFLALSPDRRVLMTLLPDAVWNGSNAVSAGHAPENPVLHLELQENERTVSEAWLAAGKRVSLGGHTFLFAGMGRWSFFRVVDDPAYPAVVACLWFGLFSLLVRYARDVYSLFRR